MKQRSSLSTVHRIAGAAYGAHMADQMALVAVPLVAALAFGATPQTIGVLVACQSIAHLLGSIPFGILIDRRQLRTLALASALMSFAGFATAVLGIVFESVHLFGTAIMLAGFGTVLFGLAALSILPRAVGPHDLAKANAGIEIPRALCALAVPLFVGFMIGEISAWALFLIACAGSILAFSFAYSLPRFPVAPIKRSSTLKMIVDGGKYVIFHRLLLPIALCALFWNFAFAALLVALVPTIQTLYQFHPGTFGIALSSFGLAAVIGSWLAGQIVHRTGPAAILLFGPASSVIAAGGLLYIVPYSSQYGLYAFFFLLGFGPSMWLVVQNSVRQIVTPSAILGRVNAVIQTAIYGIRPLGALAGGMVSGVAGPELALLMVIIAYIASFAVSLFSDLATFSSHDLLVHAGAAK